MMAAAKGSTYFADRLVLFLISLQDVQEVLVDVWFSNETRFDLVDVRNGMAGDSPNIVSLSTCTSNSRRT